jgi:proteic killer suppression protein
MEIEFDDDDLALICTDQAHKLGLPIGVIKSARRKILLLQSAPDERTLRNWKSLNYKQLGGNRKGQKQIRLNDQYRMVFLLDASKTPPVATIIEIGDTHD